MRKFFVVGLPRSRTYWMSIYLYCTHEAFHYNENYKTFMDSKSFGDSTTCYPWIKNYITDNPIVVIERDLDECFQSSIKLFPDIKIKTLEHMQSELEGIDVCLRIKYEDINERLQEIWEYCHESPFNSVRAEKLKDNHMENYPLIEATQQEIKKLYAANA